jgi:hypothetical protein
MERIMRVRRSGVRNRVERLQPGSP